MLVFGISWCHFGHDGFGREKWLKMDSSNGPSWAVRIASVADFLPSNSAWSLPREFNQQNAGDFLQITVSWKKSKNNHQPLGCFLYNPGKLLGVLNYQPLGLIGFMNHQFIAYLQSSFRGLCAPQTFSSGFESTKREAKEANPVLGLTEKLRIHKPLGNLTKNGEDAEDDLFWRHF